MNIVKIHASATRENTCVLVSSPEIFSGIRQAGSCKFSPIPNFTGYIVPLVLLGVGEH